MKNIKKEMFAYKCPSKSINNQLISKKLLKTIKQITNQLTIHKKDHTTI